MVSTAAKILAGLVILIGVIYQGILKDLLTDMGFGRVLTPFSSFNLRCEKIDNLGLEACEDMWLHEPSGHLYMACGSSLGRTKWFPPIDGHLDPSGRKSTDRIAVLDTRAPGPFKDRLRWLSTPGFSGSHGDRFLDLHGLDVRVDSSEPSKLKILLNNHRPPMDAATGALLDASRLGANSTIEVFETIVGESTMNHVKTYATPVIEVPNSVAWVSDDTFLFTNDRSSKTGFGRVLDTPLRTLRSSGSVGFCSPTGCQILIPSGLAYPNGIRLGLDGLVYVANTATGDIFVYSFSPDVPSLTRVDGAKIPFPIDNLSVDGKGDIYVASFPIAYKFMETPEDPFGRTAPTAGWKISKAKDGYEVVKVVEDDGSVLSGATVVVHDAKTGRMFLGGAVTPSISVCEPL